MPLDTTKPSSDDEKRKNLDREARDMVSVIMNRISDLHRAPGSSSSHLPGEEEDLHGMSVITLAGSNVGATMHGEMDEKMDGMSLDEPDGLDTYVNSNFQAINNSIMMGGSYSTNDPGVHLEISDFVEEKGRDKQEKNGKKGKKKDKDGVRSDHPTEQTD